MKKLNLNMVQILIVVPSGNRNHVVKTISVKPPDKNLATTFTAELVQAVRAAALSVVQAKVTQAHYTE